MRFYVSEQISPRIAETPEGFLVCLDVPVARTGKMIYNRNTESDIMPWLKDVEADESGMVTVIRDAEEVFRPETMASFEGKPVTIDHPPDLVDPGNWATFAKGNMQGVRRGESGQSDLLLSDFLITDRDAILTVKSRKKREVSCGYDADYEVVGPGLLRQRNIVGNHAAIVDKGRAGARCVIMDAENEEDEPMKNLKEVAQALKKLWKDATDEEKKEAKEEMEDCIGKTKDGEEEEVSALERLDKRISALEKSDKEVHKNLDALMKKGGTKDEEEETEEEKKKREEEEKEKSGGATTDGIRAAFQDAASRAEILVPGKSMPTFDGTGRLEDAAGILDKAKRDILSAAYATDDGRRVIELFTRGPVKDFGSLDKATCDAAFVGASELMARRNNAGFIRTNVTTKDFGQAHTVTGINKRNAEFWANRK